jgi:nucleotide-binding universal stress UspA family protein
MAAFNGTTESLAAVDAARRWALAAGATIRIVGVAEAGYLRDELEEARQSMPSELRADARLLPGNPSERLLDQAELGVDLLVVGSRGFGPVMRTLLGSVSGTVVRAAPCPVMVVPRSYGAVGDGSATSTGRPRSAQARIPPRMV